MQHPQLALKIMRKLKYLGRIFKSVIFSKFILMNPSPQICSVLVHPLNLECAILKLELWMVKKTSNKKVHYATRKKILKTAVKFNHKTNFKSVQKHQMHCFINFRVTTKFHKNRFSSIQNSCCCGGPICATRAGCLE